MAKGNDNLESQISTLSTQLESLNSELSGFRTDHRLLKELIDGLIIFRKQFDNKDGWVPKIISTVTGNFRKDIRILRDEIMGQFDKLPCYNLKFDEDGLLQSGCRIANTNEPLKPDEKEMNP